MIRSKKIIWDIIIIISAFFLFAAWYQNTYSKSVFATKQNKFYKIYLITTDKQYEYWNYVNQGASDLAEEFGIDYIWDAPVRRDANLQIEVIQKAVDNGANALLVAADDPKKISSIIEDAKARGVKVIYVDSPATEEAITTLATNNYEAGYIAGKTMLSELKQLGLSSGKLGVISIRSKANTDHRIAGFQEAVEEDGGFILLEPVYTNGDPLPSKEAAERLISGNMDLVGLFGANEGSSEGVGMAISARKSSVIGIGFDITKEMLKLLKEGGLKAVMVQNPYSMGYLGMAQAMAAIKGFQTGPSYINTGISVLKGKQVESKNKKDIKN